MANKGHQEQKSEQNKSEQRKMWQTPVLTPLGSISSMTGQNKPFFETESNLIEPPGPTDTGPKGTIS